MIYLDNAATTRAFNEVKSAAIKYFDEDYFNPSALYRSAIKVKNTLEESRSFIANVLSCQSNEIFFTSGATESNNWVINCGRKLKKGSVVTTMGEHPSAFEAIQALKSKDVDVRIADLLDNGTVNLEDLCNKIDENTTLVSIIHCSNETGAINNLAEITRLIRKKAERALIHSDGVQAFCKLKANVKQLGVDFYSISAHKVGGLKGVGALYINKNTKMPPLIFGGGQEGGFRSGTENCVGIGTFKYAAESFLMKASNSTIPILFNYIYNALSKVEGVKLNSDPTLNSGYIISASIEGVRGEILQHVLADNDIIIGLGSACASRSSNNRVLSAMGRTKREIEGSIRISLSVENSMEEVTMATKVIIEKINEIRNKIGKNLKG